MRPRLVGINELTIENAFMIFQKAHEELISRYLFNIILRAIRARPNSSWGEDYLVLAVIGRNNHQNAYISYHSRCRLSFDSEKTGGGVLCIPWLNLESVEEASQYVSPSNSFPPDWVWHIWEMEAPKGFDSRVGHPFERSRIAHSASLL
jgi:hypothetical protein